MSRGAEQDGIGSLLEACLFQVSASREWFDRRVLILSVDQLRCRPLSGQWSIAECLDHLNRTFAYYLPRIEQAVDQGLRKGKYSARRLNFEESEGSFLKQVEPPIIIRMSTPTLLLPTPAVDPDQIVDDFPQLRDRFATAVHTAASVDVLNISIADSIHPPVQSLGGAIALLAAHERRHLWQAQRVLSVSGLPTYRAAGDLWTIVKDVRTGE